MTMFHFNSLFFPTLVLALALFYSGHRAARKLSSRRALMLWGIFAVAGAVPGILFVVYYIHLLDNAGWFFTFRSLPYSEIAASGMGIGAGLAAGMLRRRMTLTHSEPSESVV